MFTTTFTLDHHIEELRAELRGAMDAQEVRCIRAELAAMLAMRDDLIRETDAAL
jgi:hypothetical protein